MRSKLLAAAGAVLLIVAAVFVRMLVSGGGGSGTGPDAAGRPVVGCSPGLEQVCDALAVTKAIAPDPPVFDLGSDGAGKGIVGDRTLDAWITWDPAGAIANLDANGATIWAEPVAIGSAPLVLASKQPLPRSCSDEVTKACVFDSGANAGVAMGTPSTIDGLLRVFPVAAAVQPDLDFRNGSVATELRGLLDARNSDPGSMWEELRSAHQRGFFDSIITTDMAARSAQLGEMTKFPRSNMTLVVTPRPGAPTGWIDAALRDESVREAIRASGVDPGRRRIEDTPDPGVLYALRQELSR